MSKNIADVSDLFGLKDKLSLLTKSEISTILVKSILAAAKKLKQNTIQSLVSKMGSSATRPIISTTTNKTYKPLVSGIKMSSDPFDISAKVHIMGHGYLRWFEKGTSIRQTKSGANRGSIKAINFFFSAQQVTISSMESIISTSLDKQINNILG